MVVMEREDYDKKSEELLSQSSYRVLPSDPTTKHKEQADCTASRTSKLKGGSVIPSTKGSTLQGQALPKYYGLPKVHKEGVPLRPIISSRGVVTYETAKELSRILKPLVGRSPHHVKNTQDFIKSIEGIQLQEDECIMSYDVNALFTSIPIEPAVNIIKQHLEEEKDLHLRTNMTVKHICCLLEFCLKNTYFLFRGRFYEQTEGTAMGTPISPIVANLFMEEPRSPSHQDITFTPCALEKICGVTHSQSSRNNIRYSLLEHLNSINPSIKFSSKETRIDGSMLYLDILITPKEDGSLQTSVYRKPTHTDLYLQWDSHHTIPSKYSVVGTFIP